MEYGDKLPIGTLARLSRVVEEACGLRFSRDRWCDLERGLAAAASAAGATSLAGWAATIRAGSLSSEQMDLLAEHLTIGETYFFRDQAIFDALSMTVIPELIRRKDSAGDRQIRVWCAGCSTGEEPYSIAMLLETLLPDGNGWDFRIHGSDLNRSALKHAEKGVYSEWSFRGHAGSHRARFFRRQGSKAWELSPKLRSRVRFTQLNLLDPVYPSAVNGTDNLDLLFCRNVLMYLAPQVATEIARRFQHCLAPRGWLVVGPSEAPRSLSSGFSMKALGDAVFYQPTTAPAPPAGVNAAVANRPVASNARIGVAPQPRRKAGPRVAKASRVPELGNGRHDVEARAAADSGDLDQALQHCDAALARSPSDPSLHYLRAAVLLEAGRVAEAENSLRRTLYLEPRFVPARISMGELALARMHPAKAQKSFTIALELLRGIRKGNAPFPTDGLSVERLTDIVCKLQDSPLL